MYDEWMKALLQIINQYPIKIYKSAPAVVEEHGTGCFTRGLPTLHSIVTTETLRNLLLRRMFFVKSAMLTPIQFSTSQQLSPQADAMAISLYTQEVNRDHLETSLLRSVINGDASNVYAMIIDCHKLLQIYYQLNRRQHGLESQAIEMDIEKRSLLSLKWASGGLAPILGFNEQEFWDSMNMSQLLARLNQIKLLSRNIQLAHVEFCPSDAKAYPRYLESLLVQTISRLLDLQTISGKSLTTTIEAIIAPSIQNNQWLMVAGKVVQTIVLYADIFTVHTGLFMSTSLTCELTDEHKANLAVPVSTIWEAFAEGLKGTQCAFVSNNDPILFEGVPAIMPFVIQTQCTAFRWQLQRFLDEWLCAIVHVQSPDNNRTMFAKLITSLHHSPSALGNLSFPVLNAQNAVSMVQFSIPGAMYTFFDRMPSSGLTIAPGLLNDNDLWKSNLIYFLSDIPSVAYSLCECFHQNSAFLDSSSTLEIGRDQIHWLTKAEMRLFEAPYDPILSEEYAPFNSEKDPVVRAAISLLRFGSIDILLECIGYPKTLTLSSEQIQGYLKLMEYWASEAVYSSQRLYNAILNSKYPADTPLPISSNPLYTPCLMDAYKPPSDKEQADALSKEIQLGTEKWINQSAQLSYSMFDVYAEQLIFPCYPSVSRFIMDHVLVRYMCLDPIGGTDRIIRLLSHKMLVKKCRYNHRNSPFTTIRSLFYTTPPASSTSRLVSGNTSDNKPPSPIYTSVVGGRVLRRRQIYISA